MQVNIQEGIIAEVHRFMTLDRETVRTFHESVIRIMELFGFDVYVDHLPQIYLRRGEDFKGRRAYLDFDFHEIHVQSDGQSLSTASMEVVASRVRWMTYTAIP